VSKRRMLNQYFSALSALDECASVDSAQLVEAEAIDMDVDCKNDADDREKSKSSHIVVGNAKTKTETEAKVKADAKALLDVHIDGPVIECSIEKTEVDSLADFEGSLETCVNADSLVVKPRRRSVRLARKERRVTLDSVSQTHRAAILIASPPASPLSPLLPVASSPSLVVRTRVRPALSPVVAIASASSVDISESPTKAKFIAATATRDAADTESQRAHKGRKERKERRRTAPVGFGFGFGFGRDRVSSAGPSSGSGSSFSAQQAGSGNFGALGDIGASIAAMAAALGEDVPVMPFNRQSSGSADQGSKGDEKKKKSKNKNKGKKKADSEALSESSGCEDSGMDDDALPLGDNLSPLNDHPPLGLADAMHMQLQLNEKNEQDDNDDDDPAAADGSGGLGEAAEDLDNKLLLSSSPISITRGASSSELLLREQARVQARLINPGLGASNASSALDELRLSSDEPSMRGSRRHRRRTAAVLEPLALPTAAVAEDNELDADDLVARRQRLRRLQERKRRRQTIAELKKRRSSWLGWMPSGGNSASNSPLRGGASSSLDNAQQLLLSSPPRSPSPSPAISSMSVTTSESASAMAVPVPHIDGSLIPRDSSSDTNVGNSAVMPARAPEEPAIDTMDTMSNMSNMSNMDSIDNDARGDGKMHVISPASQQVELHAAEMSRDSDDPEDGALRTPASISSSASRPSFTIPGSRVAARANRARGISSSTPSLLPLSRTSSSKGSDSRASRPTDASVSRTRSVASLSGGGRGGAYARGAGGPGSLFDSRKTRGTAAKTTASASASASASTSTSASALMGASTSVFASASASSNKDVHAQKRALATDMQLDGGQHNITRSNSISSAAQTPKHQEDLKHEKGEQQPRRASSLRRKSTAADAQDTKETPAPAAAPSRNIRGTGTGTGTGTGKRKALSGDAANSGDASEAEPSRRMTRSRALSLAGAEATPGSTTRRETLSAVSPVRPRRQPSKAPATARAPRRKK
ncbi:hypothetical protein FB639_002848, partial [Coemansia asiatica]